MTLERLTKKSERRRFFTWDLEWWPGTYELRLCGVYDGQRYRHYRSIKEFLEGECTAFTSGAWFYAHAGGLADCAFLFEYLITQKDVTVDARFSGSAAIVIEIRKGPNVWFFIDSYWLLRAPLKKIGAALGIEKGAKEDMLSEDMGTLIEYNRKDCVILWEAIAGFEDVLFSLGGQLQMTVASCALYLFRHSYLSKTIRTNNYINEIATDAYFASRVEVFKPKVENANYYDINSSFPYAMTEPGPGNVIRTRKTLPWGSRSIYFAEVTINTPEWQNLPSLPFRDHGRTYFPVGRWRGWFSNVDLELAQNNFSKIETVHRVIEFDPCYDLEEYATNIYNLRKRAKSEYEKMVLKILLNSLYGKFAECETKEKLSLFPSVTTCQHEPRCEDDACIRLLIPGVFLVTDSVEIRHRHVPLSAHITAIARRTLYNHLNGHDPYYCDTDSIVTKDELPTGPNLGQLKHEYRIQKAEFIAPKIYHLLGEQLEDNGTTKPKEVIRAKGFPTMNFEEFTALKDGGAVQVTRMVRAREMFSKNKVYAHEKTYDKRLRNATRTKRCVDEDTNNSRPWHVDEIRPPPDTLQLLGGLCVSFWGYSQKGRVSNQSRSVSSPPKARHVRPYFRVVWRRKSGNLRSMSEERNPTRFNAKLTRVSADLITLRVRFNDVYTAQGVNTITVPLTEKDLLKICMEGFNDLAVNRPSWAERINQEMIEALGGKYDDDAEDDASSDLVEQITDEADKADKTEESQADHGTTKKKPSDSDSNTNNTSARSGTSAGGNPRQARKAPKK